MEFVVLFHHLPMLLQAVEAKVEFVVLFHHLPMLLQAVEAKVELAHKMSELQQARDHVSEAMEQGEEAQTSIGQLRLTHDDQMTTLRQEYERKVSRLGLQSVRVLKIIVNI